MMMHAFMEFLYFGEGSIKPKSSVKGSLEYNCTSTNDGCPREANMPTACTVNLNALKLMMLFYSRFVMGVTSSSQIFDEK